ncbi:MAG: hypothetical protein IK100_07235, partial [Muribaculaceae bacterium]|nr:hypothetical protein [Muribaculaceae bacterium]
SMGVVGVLRHTAGVQKHGCSWRIAPHRRRSKALALLAYCATPLASEHFKLIVEAHGVGVVVVLRRTAGVQKHGCCWRIAPHRWHSSTLN